MDMTGIVLIVGILAGGLVALCGAVVWLAIRAFNAQRAQADLIRALADRLMAGDWANLIAGEQGEVGLIDRSVGRRRRRSRRAKATPQPTPQASDQGVMSLAESAPPRTTVGPAPRTERPSAGADDNLVGMDSLIGDPAQEERVMEPVGR